MSDHKRKSARHGQKRCPDDRRDLLHPPPVVGFDQQLQDGAGQNLPGEIVGICERGAARIALDGREPFEMRLLRGARGVGRRIARAARRGIGRLRDDQQPAVIESEPRLPLGVGNLAAVCQRLPQRVQPVRQIGIFFQDGGGGFRLGGGPGHVADEVHRRVASLDVEVELVEGDAAVVLEILLDLDLDIVASEIAAELIAIIAKLGQHRGQENPHRHGGKPTIEMLSARKIAQSETIGKRHTGMRRDERQPRAKKTLPKPCQYDPECVPSHTILPHDAIRSARSSSEGEMRKIWIGLAFAAVLVHPAAAQDYKRNVVACLQELGLQPDPASGQRVQSEQGRVLRKWYFHSEAQSMAFDNCVTRKASLASPPSGKAPPRTAR